MGAIPTTDVVVPQSPAPDDADENWVPDARPAQSSVPHAGFSARNDSWTSVQIRVLGLFKRKTLSVEDVRSLLTNVRELMTSEIGPLIYDYYRNQLLKKGLWSMRDSITKEVANGSDLLSELGDAWDYFYQTIMPTIQMVLFPIAPKDLSIREINIVGFRDHVALKLELQEHLEMPTSELPPAIPQMLLVLQGVTESVPPNASFMKLERLVAHVVNPYLGFGGLYMGSKEPVRKAKRVSSVRRPSRHSAPPPVASNGSPTMKGRAVTIDLTPTRDMDNAQAREMMRKRWQTRVPSIPALLSTVTEADFDASRRHSSYDVFDKTNE